MPRAMVGPTALLMILSVCACGSTKTKPAGPPKVTNLTLKSKLLDRPMFDVLVTPAGGGKNRPLLVFLHGYGAAPSDTVSPAFLTALRRLGDRAPVVFLPEGDTGWWHDHIDGPWATYVLHEAIPAALKRTGADPQRVAIGGISMGGFGALDLGRLQPKRFCAVGGHSPAVFERGSPEISFGFDSAADFARHDLIRLARNRSSYEAPVWIDAARAITFALAPPSSLGSYERMAQTSASTRGRAVTTGATGTPTLPSTCASTWTPATSPGSGGTRRSRCDRRSRTSSRPTFARPPCATRSGCSRGRTRGRVLRS